ncbi:serine/threonine-protein kinase [Pseudonocardia acaciae]|uniref:serine/threonine-protein kinase n=1 Tax=Pseudonocardia acaciae TaxID=551276 RepID=UPI000687866A|nr:serine/threonine-protein kinase [Pseudonocardia acaciae]
MNVGDELFGRYRLVRWIARGGMGTVWEAEDLALAQRVALKHVRFGELPPEQVEETRARTLREAKMAAQLRGHPHVVAVYDVIESDGDVWLVLEYLPSANLADLLTAGRPVSLAEIARIGAAVADALAAAHARGIVHRDIKPTNILIGSDGRTVKLTDFGISHALDEQPITRVNVVSGTPSYMAREVARGEESSPASDVFSLGATLYRALEGSPPFGDDTNPNRLLLRVATGPINPPTAHTPLTGLVMRLLEFDPSTRPDAATARDQLHAFATRVSAATQPSPAARPDPAGRFGDPRPPWAPVTKPARPLRRRRLLLAGAATVVVLAVAAGLVVTMPTLFGRGGNGPLVGVPPMPETVGAITMSGDPRAADPCALIDPAWLRQFGEPAIIARNSYVLNSCRAIISTREGDVLLDMTFGRPVSSVSSLKGEARRIGSLTVVHQSVQAGDFRPYCSNVLVLADRTQIVVEVYGPKGYAMCPVTEVGTAVAVNALARNGIVYRPGRTAEWRISSYDACGIVDPALLATVPGLDPQVRYPGFGNWSCTWGKNDKGRTKAHVSFRLDDARPGSYGDATTIAGRRAWTKLVPGDNNPQKCIAIAVLRPAATATSATELVQANVDGPLPPAELCARATDLTSALVAKTS